MVQLLREPKDDFVLPTFANVGREPNDEEQETTTEVLTTVDIGKQNFVVKLSAIGQLRIGSATEK